MYMYVFHTGGGNTGLISPIRQDTVSPHPNDLPQKLLKVDYKVLIVTINQLA